MRVKKTPGGIELADSMKKKQRKQEQTTYLKKQPIKELVGVSRQTDKAGMTGDILT